MAGLSELSEWPLSCCRVGRLRKDARRVVTGDHPYLLPILVARNRARLGMLARNSEEQVGTAWGAGKKATSRLSRRQAIGPGEGVGFSRRSHVTEAREMTVTATAWSVSGDAAQRSNTRRLGQRSEPNERGRWEFSMALSRRLGAHRYAWDLVGARLVAALLGTVIVAAYAGAGAGRPDTERHQQAEAYALHLPLSPSQLQDLQSLISERIQSTPIQLPILTSLDPESATTPNSDSGGSTVTGGGSAPAGDGYVYHGAPYGPADLWHMFGTPDAAAAPIYSSNLSGVPGPTANSPLVAVLEAGSYSDTYAHLQKYRADQTLPACPVGSCITSINENGGSKLPGDTTNGAWRFETDLDVQVISAVCPQCRILIVAADDGSVHSMVQAAQAAVAAGARWVSMSFGIPGDGTGDVVNGKSVFDNPNVIFTAATGDSGNRGASWPSSNSYVVATGGLTVKTSGTTVTASAWSGGGSGCATESTHQMSAAQSGDTDAVQACGKMRGASDISSVADANTGVLTYSTNNGSTGYYLGGGTSAAAPAIAALFALAGNSTSPGSVYLNERSGSGAVTDVTSGTNNTGGCAASRLCHAQPGWDAPTGLGMPNNLSLFGIANYQGTSVAPLAYSLSPMRMLARSRATSGGITISSQVQMTETTSGSADATSSGGSQILGSVIGSGSTSNASAKSRTYTGTLERVWLDATGLPAGVTLQAQAQYNADGSIRAWTAIPTAAPAKLGAGTALVKVYGEVRGHIVYTTVRLTWQVAATKPSLRGHAKRGHVLTAIEPVVLDGAGWPLSGVTWKYQWRIDGHKVKSATGPHFRIPNRFTYTTDGGRHHGSVSRGSRVSVRLTGRTASGTTARYSSSVRVTG